MSATRAWSDGFAAHGHAGRFYSDNSTLYSSKHIKHVLRDFHITHRWWSGNDPQANCMIELAIKEDKELLTMCRCLSLEFCCVLLQWGNSTTMIDWSRACMAHQMGNSIAVFSFHLANDSSKCRRFATNNVCATTGVLSGFLISTHGTMCRYRTPFLAPNLRLLSLDQWWAAVAHTIYKLRTNEWWERRECT